MKTFIETGVNFHIVNTGADFHSFHDLNLVLAPFTYAPAKPKLYLTDLPGGNGSLDFTEALGEVKYFDRDFVFTFSVFPEDRLTFEERQSVVSAALNGQRCKITLDKDPDFYWEGRCTVNDYQCDKRLRQIVIVATVRPYKMQRYDTVYSFKLKGVAQEVFLPNSRKTVVPVIDCTDDGTTILYKDVIYKPPKGSTKQLGIQLVEGCNLLKISGTGTITFTYQEGAL